MEERLQKILSARGVCSRRNAEELIKAGNVTVNGRTAELGEKADPDRDTICLNGAPIHQKPAVVYLMLNKPQGCVTTLSDDRGRKTVADFIQGCGARVWPVGRLDYDSEGLLIMTNDGSMTYELTHPGCEVEKEYWVEVTGNAEAALPVLRGPLELDGVPLAPARVALRGKTGKRIKLSITIHEGKNRQVRRMCSLAGLTVVRLQRVREGNLVLDPALKPGQWRFLTESEIAILSK